MKRTRPIRKKRIRLLQFSLTLFLLSILCYVTSTLFLRSYNNTLSTKTQDIQSQIAIIETQNDAVKVEIQTLSTRDRVDGIATASGLSLNQNNIVTITTTENTDGE